MIDVILGVIGVCVLLAYLISTMDKTHVLLKMLFLFVIIGSFPLISGSVAESGEHCEVVVTGENHIEKYVYGNNFTGYHWDYDTNPPPQSSSGVYVFHTELNKTYVYERICFPTGNNTPLTFHRATLLIWYAFIAYMIVYMIYIFLIKKVLERFKFKGV